MPKEVTVKVSGFHIGEEAENLSTESKGIFSEKNGTIFVIYDEIDEDGHKTSNKVKIAGETFEISKKGTASLTAIFEKDREYKTNYVTPFGTFAMTFNTRKVSVVRTESTLEAVLKYKLTINDDYSSNCTLEFLVKGL